MPKAPVFRGCPVCGGARVEVLHTQRMALPSQFAIPETFDVVACASCGMVYSDTAPDSDRLIEYYRADSYVFGTWADQPRPDPAATSAGSAFDLDRLRGSLDHLLESIDARDGRVLDIGCAAGDLLGLLADAGFTDAQGIDPSPGAVAVARHRGRRAQVGDLDALPADLGSFDIVFATHVLEHLGRPRETLARLRDLVRPGGVVYVEVPDASRYAEFLVEPFVDMNVEHINHFSAEHLAELMRRSGFRALAQGRNDFKLAQDWPYPAIFGVWRKEPAAACEPPREHTFDGAALRVDVSAYIERSRELLGRIDDVILEGLSGRRKIAVRCLGYRAWTLLASTVLRDLDIVAYIDSDPAKQALTIHGVQVTGPAARLDDDIPVVVLAYHAEAAVRAEYAATDPTRDVIVLGRSRDRKPIGSPA